jgi:hypothetical protein
MQLTNKQLAGIFSVLLLLVTATRYNHFGSAISLPDASLATFLLAGFLFARFILPALLAFTLMLLVAGATDYYAIHIQGVSDYCFSPAYWFLIPTYATMWFAGRWLAAHSYNSLRNLALFGGVSWLASSAAFAISNGSFYLLSGNFTAMSAIEYSSRVLQYYIPYVGASLLYLSLAVMLYLVLGNFYRAKAKVATH